MCSVDKLFLARVQETDMAVVNLFLRERLEHSAQSFLVANARKTFHCIFY